MLYLDDAASGRWRAQCSRCLVAFDGPLVGTREEVAAELVRACWELVVDADLVWCLECSRRAREVPFPPNARGVKRRRR